MKTPHACPACDAIGTRRLANGAIVLCALCDGAGQVPWRAILAWRGETNKRALTRLRLERIDAQDAWAAADAERMAAR